VDGPRRKRSRRYANAVLAVQIFWNVGAAEPRGQVFKIKHEVVFLVTSRVIARMRER
jgi:hypothetical protein